MLHPLEICEFDPILIDGITNKLQDTKELMVQLCINKMVLKLDDAKEVFNDEDFVNKVRFHKTKKVIHLEDYKPNILSTPSINGLNYVIIDDLLNVSPGTYVCKSKYNGKMYIEHFILLKNIVPYVSLRVQYSDKYMDGIYSCIQTLIDNNKKHLSEKEHTQLLRYLICDKDPLNIEDISSSLIFNMIRISTEIVKRVAHVQSVN